MIKNERQYRITRAQASRFSNSLSEIRAQLAQLPEANRHLLNVKEKALRSQLSDLEADIKEYEDLKSGSFEFNQLKGVGELPRQLIRARIASGMSQRDLGNRMGLKEQQIQRYEATEYASASFARIGEVLAALNIDIDSPILTQDTNFTMRNLIATLTQNGLPIEFVRKRLVPRTRQKLNDSGDVRFARNIADGVAAELIGKIFQWSSEQMFSGKELKLAAIDGVRFKVTANAQSQRTSAYTVYAHYVALLAIQAYADSPMRPINTDPGQLRSEIRSAYGTVTLRSIVNHLWDLGVIVLPLDDPGAFHGACFREGGRNVIVLKQKTPSVSRWAFDCLHECWHAAQEPDLPERTVIEYDEMSGERRRSSEEATASRFAGAVLLGGRGQELAEMCLSDADFDLRRLKSTVQRIAVREGVGVDVLANYLAFRLADEQKQNWWGTANSLQEVDEPWSIVRDVFFERTDLTKLSEPDRELLSQALAPWG